MEAKKQIENSLLIFSSAEKYRKYMNHHWARRKLEFFFFKMAMKGVGKKGVEGTKVTEKNKNIVRPIKCWKEIKNGAGKHPIKE